MILFSQHDEKFPYISSRIKDEGFKYIFDLPQHGGGQFFIRKFDNDPNLTAEQLRREEYEMTSKLLSDASKINWQYHVADFYKLCGGRQLVSLSNPFGNNLVSKF